MKKVSLITIAMLLIFSSCKRKSSIDFSELDSYLKCTDSLNVLIDTKYQNVIDGIYSLIDDTIKADSISRIAILPGNQMFYPFLQNTLTTSDEIYYYSLQEIFFTKDQLSELKNDAAKRQVSNVQYEIQLDANIEMYKILKERIDSSIKYFDSVSDILFFNVTDTL